MLEADDEEENGQKPSKIRQLLSTCPPNVAEELATFLVENRHAACVNIVQQVTSIFRWEGKIQKEAECLLLIKCPKGAMKETLRVLVERHPYDVPEVIALTVKDGNPDYLDWVSASVKG